MPINIPTAFVLKTSQLSWSEWYWGYSENYVSAADLIGMAQDMLASNIDDPDLLDLATTRSEDEHEIRDKLLKLAQSDKPVTEDVITQTWLLIVLRYAYENRNKYEDPLGLVEHIYADFGYPKKMRNLVRYLPPDDGYDPSKFTHKQNIERLFRNWRDFAYPVHKTK